MNWDIFVEGLVVVATYTVTSVSTCGNFYWARAGIGFYLIDV